jgi:L-fuconolactonase
MTAGTQITDGNVHLVEAWRAAPRDGDSGRGDWPEGQTLTVQRYRAAMDAAGIARAVLTTTVRADGFDNSYTARCSAADPDRFAFVGNIDVLAPGAPAVLEELATRFGMTGARFYGGSVPDAADWLGDDRAAAAWAAAGRLGLVAGAQRTRANRLDPLAAMAARFPDVPVVVNTAGDTALIAGADPAAAQQLCALARLPNVLVMMSGQSLLAAGDAGGDATPQRDFLQRLAGAFGPDRLMWGCYSIYAGARLPGSSPSLGDLVAGVAESLSFLSGQDLSLVLGGTAEQAYWRQARRAASGGS